MAAITIHDHQVGEETYDEYTVCFYDDNIFTLVTSDPGKVAEWISEIEYIHHRRLHRLIVGIDVEWRPNNRFYTNPVATLQLCVGRRCLIFQLLYCPKEDIPQELYNFLNNPDYTFVGVGVHRDLAKLNADYGIGVGGNVVDLGVLAANEYGDRGFANAGLKGLARAVLGREVDKPRWVTLSSWDQDWLDLEQIQYACVDAFVSFEIGRVLNASSFGY